MVAALRARKVLTTGRRRNFPAGLLGPHFLCRNAPVSTPAYLSMARKVLSGVSPGVVRAGCVAVLCRVEPDFVGAGGVTMELQSQLLQPLDDLPVAEAGWLPPQVATISG